MIVWLLLFAFAGAMKGIMDRSSELQVGDKLPALFRSDPFFWIKSASWVRKWKNGDPRQGEAFPGSSTFFVAFTDGWHLAQMFFLETLFVIIALNQSVTTPLIAFIATRTVFGLAFEGTRKLLGG